MHTMLYNIYFINRETRISHLMLWSKIHCLKTNWRSVIKCDCPGNKYGTQLYMHCKYFFLIWRAKKRLSIYWKTSIKKLRVCKRKTVTRYCYEHKLHSIKMLQNCLAYYCKVQLWQCKTFTFSLNRINHSNTNAKYYCYMVFSEKYACSHWLIHLTKMNDTIFC